MPHPIASLALSLAPFAADLVGKVVNMKKDSKSKKDLNERLEKLENYEVEQAKLIEELTLKVEFLQNQQKKMKHRISLTISIGVLIIGIVVIYLFLNSI